MTRRNRPRIYDDDDDEPIPPRRTRGVVASYTEELDLGLDDEFDYQEPQRATRKSTRSKLPKESDDEFYDDHVSEDDEFLTKLEEDNFVAPDADEDEGDYYYRKRRRRTRSKEPAAENVIQSDNDDIQQEIAELYDSSPIREAPLKHKLRQRQEKIDYTLPPPKQPPATSNSRFRKPNNNKFEYRKLLYPTAGPFGGSDVISLFGTNIPPGGIPVPGLTNESNMTAIGQNVSDLDSSDDEIVPINQPKLGFNASTSNNITSNNKTQLITAGSANPKDKSKNNLSDTDPLGIDMNIDFSAVGGLDNYINQLKEMVALPLLYPELYQNFGITPPRGVLFHGPPGTGKTLMARALAASCSTETRKITFYMRKGADCLSKWVGEAERQLRLLFEEAKKNQPSIIFFDEIDGLAPVRSSKQEQIHASIVSTLLALMDGMDNRGQVIVIGATNRPDSIDPALRRPGRFDREFFFPLPDINSRQDIIKIQTKKWSPPLQDDFVAKLAELTKGYGGADLRALCTEAALNSIQRKYPQIYKSNDKLKVNPSKIHVIAKDFMNAIDKIVPSSARSSSTGSAPLPNHLTSVLKQGLDEVTTKLNHLLPNAVGLNGSKKPTALDEAMYLDPTINDPDGGFARQQLLKNLESSRICKPNLLICGNEGNGQQYLSAAILNYLEGFQVQSLDMGNIFGDASRTPELSIVQAFIEARRHQPSIIFIPNIDIWFQVVPYPAKATLTSLLRNLKSNEQVLLLGVAETNFENLDNEIKSIFGFNSPPNNVHLQNPTREQRKEYFKSLKSALYMKPYEFVNDLENRPKRKLKQLKVVDEKKGESKEATDKKTKKQREYLDTKLKNLLKIKLAGLMDLFKNRYKRFKKPIIDEGLLYHLFDPTVIDNPMIQYDVLYVKSDDIEHEHMIKELHSGKYYYNMDLDVIEERLWNGFYSEPKQFLKDIRLILKDSMTSGDRDRILKANEMLTNAQFGIDDFSTPDFLKACKELREREVEKQKKLLEDHKKLEADFQIQKAKELKEAELAAQNAAVLGEPIMLDQPNEIDEPIESNQILETNQQIDAEQPIAEEEPIFENEFESTEKPSLTVTLPYNQHEFIIRDEEDLLTENFEGLEYSGLNGSLSNGNHDFKKTEEVAEPKSEDIKTYTEVGGINDLLNEEDVKSSNVIEPIVEPAPIEESKPEITEPEPETSVIVDEPAVDVEMENVITDDPPTVEAEVTEPIVEESESDGESEVEESDQIIMDRDLTVDDDKFDQFFNETLLESTSNCNLEKIETAMARLMDIVWQDRKNWDKSNTIEALIQEVERLKVSFT